MAIILHSKRPASATSDFRSEGTSSACNDLDDDEDDADRLQRSYIHSDTDTVAGKVSISVSFITYFIECF